MNMRLCLFLMESDVVLKPLGSCLVRKWRKPFRREFPCGCVTCWFLHDHDESATNLGRRVEWMEEILSNGIRHPLFVRRKSPSKRRSRSRSKSRSKRSRDRGSRRSRSRERRRQRSRSASRGRSSRSRRSRSRDDGRSKRSESKGSRPRRYVVVEVWSSCFFFQFKIGLKVFHDLQKKRPKLPHFLSSGKFSRNFGSMPKTSTHVLSNSRKRTTWFLVKSIVECYGSDGRLLLTRKSFKFASVSAELHYNRSPRVLDFDKGVCCHHSSS